MAISPFERCGVRCSLRCNWPRRWGASMATMSWAVLPEEREKNGNQPAHDMRVAVADEGEARGPRAPVNLRGEPDLANTALHLVDLSALRLGQRLEPAPELDHIAVAVFPVVEQLEIGQDILEARGAGFIHCVHRQNIRENGRGCDLL